MINNPFAEDGIVKCQWCNSGDFLENEAGIRNNFCGKCGHKIDWPEENNNDKWRDATKELPYTDNHAICSEDVEVKYRNGNKAVGFIAYNGRWFNSDYSELDPPAYWRPLQTKN